MWQFAVAVVKPFVVLWAALNAIDDISLLMRVSRLVGSVLLPGRGNRRGGGSDLCEVCDDVMGDLLRGTEGLSAVPCGAACLGSRKCVAMCESVKEVSATSTQFPCVAAGYCDAVEAHWMDTDDPEECRPGPFFSCRPREYCRRKRKGVRMTCDLRPGIGRWVGMKHAARDHAVALAEGLISQPYCGEERAGPYCIAKPTGFGAVAEVAGHFISLVVGGYKSVLAIESPGGSDDRQWLTFWLIFTITLFCERFFARVILSKIPFYYEAKLALLIWLIWQAGAEKIYRKLRRFLSGSELLLSDEKVAEKQLEIMKITGKTVVENQLSRIRKNTKKENAKHSTTGDWEYDNSNDASPVDCPNVARQLYLVSKFLLSSEGASALQNCAEITEEDAALLVERAAGVISFEPRFLRLRLRGTLDGPRGELPPMDRNGRADAYVTCRLLPEDGDAYPAEGVTSRIVYQSLRPTWNEELELPLLGGSVDTDGYFKSSGVAKTTKLYLTVLDADVGRWGVVYNFFRVVILGVMSAVVVAHVKGITDNLTDVQWFGALVVGLLVEAGFVLSYIMAVVNKSDDETIGVCTVPLSMLLDQREHALLLTLCKPETPRCKKRINVATTNPIGGLGVLRVSLVLSEH